jgi:hypothetical protein
VDEVFLVGNRLAEEIRGCWVDCPAPRIAVAFWGHGAISRLGLDQTDAPTQVLCDLFSGGCNPTEISRLVQRKHTEVRWLTGLHAKVYLGHDRCVVTSANASANGLGFEGDLNLELEAGFLFQTPRELADARTWFAKLWRSAQHNEIDGLAIARASKLWKAQRLRRPWPQSSKSLLALIRADDVDGLADRPIRLWAYPREEPSDFAKKKVKALDDREVQRVLANGLFPGWEVPRGVVPAAGMLIIDFDYDQDGIVEYGGIWRVRHTEPIPTTKGQVVALADEVRGGIDGLNFSRSDARVLARRIEARITGGDRRELDLGLDEIGVILKP